MATKTVTHNGVEYPADHFALPANLAARVAGYQRDGHGLTVGDTSLIADALEGDEKAEVEARANAEFLKTHRFCTANGRVIENPSGFVQGITCPDCGQGEDVVAMNAYGKIMPHTIEI